MSVMGRNIGYVSFFYKRKSAKRLKRLLAFIVDMPLIFIVDGVFSPIRNKYRYRTQGEKRMLYC